MPDLLIAYIRSSSSNIVNITEKMANLYFSQPQLTFWYQSKQDFRYLSNVFGVKTPSNIMPLKKLIEGIEDNYDLVRSSIIGYINSIVNGAYQDIEVLIDNERELSMDHHNRLHRNFEDKTRDEKKAMYSDYLSKIQSDGALSRSNLSFDIFCSSTTSLSSDMSRFKDPTNPLTFFGSQNN